MLPGLVALCWKLTGQESTDAPIAIAFLFALGTVGVLMSALGALRGKAYALLGGTMLARNRELCRLERRALWRRATELLHPGDARAVLPAGPASGDLRFSALAGLMAGFAAWTRNEGIIFVAAVLVARAIALLRFRRAEAARPPAAALRRWVWRRRWRW